MLEQRIKQDWADGATSDGASTPYRPRRYDVDTLSFAA